MKADGAAYGADRKAEALTPRACGSKGLVRFLHSFPFSFLLYLFVMNDREIPRNKFDSTLRDIFPLHHV
jgi:hypothetical protein